ncbi:hypothetical protein Taro_014785 [Colocasia esculenta]|uniref:Uncharacterized protein n=1 Tax=Colocasia esculenta TaxID=4460 RepID=A0A843UFV5_COLES|nr:hypothetical protein [Colocasia esculenta]
MTKRSNFNYVRTSTLILWEVRRTDDEAGRSRPSSAAEGGGGPGRQHRRRRSQEGRVGAGEGAEDDAIFCRGGRRAVATTAIYGERGDWRKTA